MCKKENEHLDRKAEISPLCTSDKEAMREANEKFRNFEGTEKQSRRSERK
jgi:hypothetical protein